MNRQEFKIKYKELFRDGGIATFDLLRKFELDSKDLDVNNKDKIMISLHNILKEYSQINRLLSDGVYGQ